MLLSYVLHSNVATLADVVDKIRLFAVSVGWIEHEHKTGYVFGPKASTGDDYYDPREWRTDPQGAYLCLTSNGIGGGQGLIAKIEVGNYIGGNTPPYNCGNYAEYVSEDYRIVCNMCSSTSYEDGTGSDTYLNPFQQYGLCLGRDDDGTSGYYNLECATHSFGLSLPHDEAITKLWLFGNSHWIAVVALIKGELCTMMHFGSFDMFDTAPTQGYVCGHSGIRYGPETDCGDSGGDNVNSYDYVAHYSIYTAYSPTKHVGAFVLKDVGMGRTGSNNQHRPRLIMYWNDQNSKDIYQGDDTGDMVLPSIDFTDLTYTVDSWNNYVSYHKLLTAHTSNNRRPMAKCLYYWKRSGDGVYEPIGQTPCYFMASTGLDFGQVLTYGSEQYMVFPMATKLNNEAIAFRIA